MSLADRPGSFDEENFGQLLEGAPDAMVVVRSDGRIALLNAPLETLFGYRRDELVGRPIEVLIPEQYRALHNEHRAHYLANPHTRPMGANLCLRALRKDGTEFPVEISLSPMQVDGATWVTAAIRDISKHVQTEAVLREAKDAAQVADGAKTDFLTELSRECRTPISALLGFADLLLEPMLSESERMSYAAIIRRNSEHLLSLLNEMLDVSRIEAGRIEVEHVEFPPSDLLLEVRALSHMRAVHKGLAFVLECGTDMPSTVRGDPTRLRQLILNLVNAAIKLVAHGEVRVTASFQREGVSDRGQLIVRVCDVSRAPAAADVERVLAPSSQAEARRTGGGGLGLSICAPLTKALGGTLSVDTEPGHDSTFTLSVPVECVEPSPESSGAHRGLPSTLHGRVLLVEDAPDNQLLFGTLLGKHGAQVVSVSDAEHAVEEALAAATVGAPFDLVLMDMQLPDFDGYAATSKLRAAGYTKPIVALSLRATASERERCLAAGCTDYLSRPVGRIEWIRAVSPYLQSQPQANASSPMIAPKPRGDRHAARPSPQLAPSIPCVLVIDDADDIHALVAARLSSERVTVLGALSGRAGLDAAFERLPDLVLLDVELPDLDGLAVCRALKADVRTSNIPVLFLAGTEDTATKETAFELGATDYITKPFDVIELRARVRAALRMKKYQDLLAARAQLDALTGLWNRGYFETRLRDELSASVRHRRQLCVAIVDLDRFKNINDSYGHPFGDHVLQTFSEALQHSLRASDVACRYGGEEFAVILPHTSAANGVLAAERIRLAVERLPLSAAGQPVQLTVSIGVAAFDAADEHSLPTDPAALVEAADAALYRAKRAGRNRVMLGG